MGMIEHLNYMGKGYMPTMAVKPLQPKAESDINLFKKKVADYDKSKIEFENECVEFTDSYAALQAWQLTLKDKKIELDRILEQLKAEELRLNQK